MPEPSGPAKIKKRSKNDGISITDMAEDNPDAAVADKDRDPPSTIR